MTDVGGIAGAQLRSYIERIERLNEEEAAIKDDKREVFAEAKGNGFDPKIMRQVIAARKIDPDDRAERETLFDLYMRAISEAGTTVANAQARIPREEVAAAMDRSAARSRDYIRSGTLTPHDPDTGEVIEPAAVDTAPEPQNAAASVPESVPESTTPAAAPTVSIVWPTEPNTTAAPSQGSTGGRPGEPSPDEVLAAAGASCPDIASQSERSTTPSRDLGVTEDIPAHLVRQKVAVA